MNSLSITTDIALTSFERGDKANLLQYLNDETIFANTSNIPHPYTEVHADQWLDLTEKELVELGFPINWAIRHAEYGAIGGIGSFLRAGLEGHRDEIGYWLAKPFRGTGLMTTVVQHFCTYLLETRPALVRIEARVMPHNSASARVLEKAGFEREGYAKKLILKQGAHLDSVLFALIR